MKHPGPVLVAFLLGLAGSPARAADSAYTTHDYETCRLVSDEPGSQRRRCDGFAGIAVNYYGSDDDATVDFGEEGAKHDGPYQPPFVFAGKTIEWRGIERNGALAPYAAIVRFDMGHAIGGPFRPELMIFRLDGSIRSCLAASVDGRRRDANVRARHLADTFVRSFACGKDARRPME
jgi:hypothetical protein